MTMKQNYTHMILVLDESGSMGGVKDATIEGINSLVNKQKQDPGDFTTALYKFSEKTSPKVVFTELNGSSYTPYGGTALNDAVCMATEEEGKWLSEKPEEERPDKVVVVIVTDGYENSSKTYTLSDVKDRIKHQEEVYNWKFVFLGANIDAFHAGSSYGIATRSTVQWDPTDHGVKSLYANVSEAMTLYKAGVSSCVDLGSLSQAANNGTIPTI